MSASGDMELYDLRVTVDSISGRPVCGLAVGDYFEVTESSRLPASDWLEQDSLVACPDPEERLVMRITRTVRRSMRTSDLT
jgi:hypothetical protein